MGVKTKTKISELSYVESFFAPKNYKANPSKKALAKAPIVVVLCADPDNSSKLWGRSIISWTRALPSRSLMLAACGLGLGAVFMGVYDEEKIKALTLSFRSES